MRRRGRDRGAGGDDHRQPDGLHHELRAGHSRVPRVAERAGHPHLRLGDRRRQVRRAAHGQPAPAHGDPVMSAALPGARPVRAPRGTELSCKGWQQEAALRMLMNNLDPAVAENPDARVVYGGTGRAARSWAAFDAIVRELRALADDETLLVQSGKPVAVFRTHEWAPRVLIANSNLVGKWATWDVFRDLEAKGLMMYGQMTAGSWIYIGTQGILQGTYETFAQAGRTHFGSADLSGRTVLSGGLGGMGGAQPLAATMNNGVFLGVEVDPSRAKRRLETRYLDVVADNLDHALKLCDEAVR